MQYDRETIRKAYSARDESGEFVAVTRPRDFDRFSQTLHLIPSDVRSLLDCGCGMGHWLNYVREKRILTALVGIDVAEERTEGGMKKYPGLDLRQGFLEDIGQEIGEFDMITCLEVLEHIPDWRSTLHTMLNLARKFVLVTVPNNERIINTACIHCGKTTPLYGHLRSFTPESFPDIEGWRKQVSYILDRGVGRPSLLKRWLLRLRPRKAWLACRYTRIQPR